MDGPSAIKDVQSLDGQGHNVRGDRDGGQPELDTIAQHRAQALGQLVPQAPGTDPPDHRARPQAPGGPTGHGVKRRIAGERTRGRDGLDESASGQRPDRGGDRPRRLQPAVTRDEILSADQLRHKRLVRQLVHESANTHDEHGGVQRRKPERVKPDEQRDTDDDHEPAETRRREQHAAVHPIDPRPGGEPEHQRR